MTAFRSNIITWLNWFITNWATLFIFRIFFIGRIVNEYGFSIAKFKVDDECYEIYGWETDENGKEQKIEVYFDAKTGDIVKKK